MKSIILCLSLLVFGFMGYGQTNYDTCNNLQKYAGEWRYTNGQDTIRIYLRTSRVTDQTYNVVQDRLWGWHEYKKGNTVVQTDYAHRFMTLNSNAEVMLDSTSIALKQFRNCSNSYINLTGLIVDYNKGSQAKNVTASFNSLGTEMLWKQTNGEGQGAINGIYGMTLPKEFLLIKQ